MKIAVDLDEVLGDFLTAYLDFYNEKHRTQWKREHFTSYHFWETVGGTRESHTKLAQEFFDSEHFDEIKPLEAAIDGIRKLSEEHTLILITARPKEIEEKTKAWLDAHYPEVFAHIHLVGQYTTIGVWRSKAEICIEEDVPVIIEDNLQTALECAAQGIRALLIDAPWNQDGNLPERVVRVDTWEHIHEEIRRTDL